MFSSPFTTRPPRRSDWAGGPRGVAALASVAVALVVEVVALVVASSSASAGAVVALVAVLLVPIAAFLCGYAGAWRGPARRWGIGAGILLVLPPVGVLLAFLPLSFLYVIAVGVVGFAGHLIGRRREPERRFD